MATVRDIMTVGPIVLESSTSVHAAAEQMRDADVGDVLVEEDGTLRGLVTDRDIAVRVVAEGLAPDSITVGQVCSGELHAVAPGTALGEVVELMRREAIRRVPVVEDGIAVGVVSIGDLAIDRDGASALAEISAARGNT